MPKGSNCFAGAVLSLGEAPPPPAKKEKFWKLVTSLYKDWKITLFWFPTKIKGKKLYIPPPTPTNQVVDPFFKFFIMRLTCVEAIYARLNSYWCHSNLLIELKYWSGGLAKLIARWVSNLWDPGSKTGCAQVGWMFHHIRLVTAVPSSPN